MNYKQYKRILYENGDMNMKNMMFGEQLQTVAELMASPLYKYISLSSNKCGYGGTKEEFIVNYVHLLFLKAIFAPSRKDNTNWREATARVFSKH